MRTLFAIACLLSCAPLGAHDFWIEPSTFRPVPGSVLGVSLRVGQDFAGDPIPRSASLIDAFFLRDDRGTRDVIGREHAEPAGLVRFEASGCIVYRSKANVLESTPAKFAQFLREEGLPPVATTDPHRERFFRYAKSFVGGQHAGFDRPAGLRLELVPLTDPAGSSPLRVRLLFEGKPLARALVTAIHRDDASLRLAERTDAQGVVTLPLAQGVWLVKSVHLVRARDQIWESLWASLTFER